MRIDLDSPVGKLCQKCRHVRRRDDTGPVYACPACGAVYAKVAAVVQAKEEERREAARNFASAAPPPPAPPAAPPLPDALAAERRRVLLAHAVYLLFVLPLGITPVVGVVIAHAAAANDPHSWLASHFRWLIRTFWTAAIIGAVLLLVAGLIAGGAMLAGRQSGEATGSGFGWLLWIPTLALALWALYRIARGWLVLLQGEAV